MAGVTITIASAEKISSCRNAGPVRQGIATKEPTASQAQTPASLSGGMCLCNALSKLTPDSPDIIQALMNPEIRQPGPANWLSTNAERAHPS